MPGWPAGETAGRSRLTAINAAAPVPATRAAARLARPGATEIQRRLRAATASMAATPKSSGDPVERRSTTAPPTVPIPISSRPSRRSARSRQSQLTAAIIVVIGLGSVFFFLGATAQVYEEAEMWGAALALGSFYALVGFLDRPSTGRLVATGVLTTLALLTRGSVGAGPVAALGLAAAVYLLTWLAKRVPRWQSTIQRLPRAFGIQVPDAPGRFGVGLVAAVAIPVVLYVAIKEIKFGTLFRLPLNRQVLTLTNAHPRPVLAANGGSLFGLKFLPTNLLQFTRPDALTPTRLFPWVFFPW